MSYDRNYRRTTTTTTSNRNNRRPLYAPPPPPGAGNRHHSVLGYWVPLITIGTIAVGGLAAWIWSERNEHDEDDYPPDNKPQRPPTGMGASYPTQGSQPYPGPQYPPSGPPGGMAPPVGAQPPPPQQQQQQPYQPPPGGEASSYYGSSQTQVRTSETRQTEQSEDGTFFGRVSGAMRRAPSPQQFFDSASRQVTAGVAAAGAAAGAALSSIMEEDRHGQAYGESHAEKEGFSDHERWSEEADELKRVNMVESESSQRVEAGRSTRDGKGKPKRSVAVVVTADIDAHVADEDAEYHTEHGSILSHLPAQHDPSQTELFVLIYAPGLKSLPPLDYQPGRAPSTLGSSFSTISTPAVTPGSELQSISPRIDATEPPATKHFEVLYNQALSLVASPAQILPFTTPDGYVHMLRHLAPQLVYVSDTLSGRDGDAVAQLKGWVGHTILVAGDDGHGGLADTETEDERSGENTVKWRWYENSPLVGLGKDIEVVDAARVGDDWNRRVFNKE